MSVQYAAVKKNPVPAVHTPPSTIIPFTAQEALSQSQQILLNLQRQIGNRAARRCIARQGTGEAEVSPGVETAIRQAHGGGQALNSNLRVQMESAFGANFSGVRVHTDSQANELNRALNARAFTTGQDIFFRNGEYAPGGSNGRELIAHELTHVVQQQGDQLRTKLMVNAPGDRYEDEAEQTSKEIIRREQLVNQISRQEDDNMDEEDKIHTRLDTNIQRQDEVDEEER